MDENSPQINEVPEEYTDDLQKRFSKLLKADNKEAIEIYEKILRLLDKERDKELSVPYVLPGDVTPQELLKMHQDTEEKVRG